MGPHRPHPEFSQFVNQHTSAGSKEMLMPQIMAQNYKKMMKYNKQAGALFNSQNGQDLTAQQQLLQSIDSHKLDLQADNVESINQK
jgi:hypothetical protein